MPEKKKRERMTPEERRLRNTLGKIEAFLQKYPGDPAAGEDMLAAITLLGDCPDAHTYNFNLRNHIAGQLRSGKLPLVAAERWYRLQRRSLLFDAKTSLDAYLQFLEYDREPEKRFYLPRRKQLFAAVSELQRLHDGDLMLLAISMPPGVGKSTLGIFFLSWEMGCFPLEPNLASAHADKLTRSFYDGVLSILTDPDYLWSEVFPGAEMVGTNAKEESIDLQKVKRFKTLTCRSIDGSLTGATRCERILYADDLVSGIEEAMSKDRMQRLWEKYTSDLKSRKKQKCRELHIATRWTVHDPIGRLQVLYDADPKAKFLAMPAVDEDGRSNFDYQFGVGFSTQYFADMKRNLDDVTWRCLFMNEPIEREGQLYQEDELRRYYELPEGKPDAILAICDTAEGGGDDTFMPVAYQYGEDYYIEDCVCAAGKPEYTDPMCISMLLKHGVHFCRFESNAAGGRTADKVNEGVKAAGGLCHITKRRTLANKETRIIVNSDFVKQHFLFRDPSCYPSRMYEQMLAKMCSYTLIGKNKHDDVPDGMAQLVEFILSRAKNTVEVFKRPF